MLICSSSFLGVLLLTHSPIFFSVLSGCVDDQHKSKYSIDLFVVRAAASDNAPSSVAVFPPINSSFKVLFAGLKSSSNMSYTSVTNVIVSGI